MPKKAKIETTATGKKFKVVNPNAAGIYNPQNETCEKFDTIPFGKFDLSTN